MYKLKKMKFKTIEEQTLYLYNYLAQDIEWGMRDIKSDFDSVFADPRGGFIASLMWTERHVKTELSGVNLEVASKLLIECRLLLENIQKQGWTIELKYDAINLIEKLRGQEWDHT